MAYGFVTADPAAWASALSNLGTLQAADLPPSRGPQATDGRDATDLLAAAEVAVLDLPAPTLSAVIDKLTILWKSELWDDSPDADHRQMVIGDLRRLAFFQP